MENKKTVFNWQLYLGFVLVVTGGLFLADQILDTNLMRSFWPLLIVLLGFTFFIGMIFAGKRGAGLAIPGTMIMGLGVLLFIQNLLNIWITWAYAWALLISTVGLGILIMNFYLKRETLRRVGGLIIGIGLILFVIFGVLFEVILNIAGTDNKTGFFLGGGMVLLGLFVVFSKPLLAKKQKKLEEEEEKEEQLDVAFTDVEEVPQPASTETAFSGVYFKGIGEVILVQGECCDLKIEGKDERIKDIQTTISEGFLSITYSLQVQDWMEIKRLSQDTDIRYYVTLNKLEHLDLAGAGNIRGESLQGDNLGISHSGVGEISLKELRYHHLDVSLEGLGDIQLAGSAQSQNVGLSGSGNLHADEMKTDEANVMLSGTGSVIVWVEKEINAEVTGAGSIEYKGDPKVEITGAGADRVKPLQ